MKRIQAKEALIQASRIIDQWEKNELDSREAMELIAPLLQTLTTHIERVLDSDPAAGSTDLNLAESEEIPGVEVEKEELKEGKEGDLFSKTESEEEEKENVEDKSKSSSKKKRKEFAGSNGEIPF